MTQHEELDFGAQLSAYLDGELDAADRAAVEKRLMHDASARAELEALRETARQVSSLPREAAPKGLLEAVMLRAFDDSNADTKVDVPRRGGIRRLLRPMAAVAALLAMTVLAGVWMVVQEQSGGSSSAPATLAMKDDSGHGGPSMSDFDGTDGVVPGAPSTQAMRAAGRDQSGIAATKRELGVVGGDAVFGETSLAHHGLVNSSDGRSVAAPSSDGDGEVDESEMTLADAANAAGQSQLLTRTFAHGFVDDCSQSADGAESDVSPKARAVDAASPVPSPTQVRDDGSFRGGKDTDDRYRFMKAGEFPGMKEGALEGRKNNEFGVGILDFVLPPGTFSVSDDAIVVVCDSENGLSRQRSAMEVLFRANGWDVKDGNKGPDERVVEGEREASGQSNDRIADQEDRGDVLYVRASTDEVRLLLQRQAGTAGIERGLGVLTAPVLQESVAGGSKMAMSQAHEQIRPNSAPPQDAAPEPSVMKSARQSQKLDEGKKRVEETDLVAGRDRGDAKVGDGGEGWVKVRFVVRTPAGGE